MSIDSKPPPPPTSSTEVRLPTTLFDDLVIACGAYDRPHMERALAGEEGVAVRTNSRARAAALDVVGREVARQLASGQAPLLDEIQRRNAQDAEVMELLEELKRELLGCKRTIAELVRRAR